MKKCISFTLMILLACAAISFAADSAALEAKEKAAWQAFKDKKADDFKKLVSPNLVALYADGASDLQGELAGMNKWTIQSFEFSNYKVTMTDSDTAISTYDVQLNGTLDGNDMSGMHHCASIWQMKNGDWQAIFHTDMKAAPATR